MGLKLGLGWASTFKISASLKLKTRDQVQPIELKMSLKELKPGCPVPDFKKP